MWRRENLISLFSQLDRKYKRSLSQISESMIKRRDSPPSQQKASDEDSRALSYMYV